MFEVLFHWLIVVDIDQGEDQHSFLLYLFRIVVVRSVEIVVLFDLIHFEIVFDFVRIVDGHEIVQFDEFQFLYERLLNHFVFYEKKDEDKCRGRR